MFLDAKRTPQPSEQDEEPPRKRRKVVQNVNTWEIMEQDRWTDHFTLAQVDIKLVSFNQISILIRR